RRACRLAREVFLEASGGDAAILPRVTAIGDIDEDELIFAGEGTGDLAAPALNLPETIAPLERRLLLAKLVSAWARSRDLHGEQGTPLVANTPASALALADDLARLMDDMTTRGVGWDKFNTLVPDDLDPFWKLSFGFLQIVGEQWTKYLDGSGLIEPPARRDALIEAETKRLMTSNAPVIAAGSTGSMPATAKLLAAIARLPRGAVVLPGLDMSLDETSWKMIANDETAAVGHPQFAMQALLARLEITRAAVTELAPSGARETLVSEALRPASTTELWQTRLQNEDIPQQTGAALAGISVIEAATAEEEALAIAVALREAAETPGKTAALVTPDRALARRVLAALDRWNVAVDDSGGDALADTPAGVFARLAAQTALGGCEPVPLLALLKHPLFRLDAAANGHRRATAALERLALRGPRPKPGSAGLAHALETFETIRDGLRGTDQRKWVHENDRADARELVAKLTTALAPLEKLPAGPQSLAELAQRHREVVAVLSREGKQSAAFAGNDGTRLDTLLTELAVERSAASDVPVPAADYVEVFETLAASGAVRMREQPNVRIRIFGPLEARLQHIDRMVLGSLNEGTWPPDTRTDPWLSRPMRRELGLNLPELRVGLTAHDFAQALGAREVILTRSAKAAGAPTVSSRFMQRLAALAGDRLWTDAKARGQRYVDWSHSIDHPAKIAPAERPQPKPPRDARPQRLSVTDIENWLRDPYTIYAKHVLKLRPLDAVDTLPGAADRGSVIHKAIGDFTGQFAAELPADPERELIALGEASFAPLSDYPEAKAFWWPRFKRIANWFAGWERERRPDLETVYGEIDGMLDIKRNDGVFTLSARADRIERRRDGTYVVVDYKTGSARTGPQVQAGLAPQLTLEAAMLIHGGFKAVQPGSVSEITYITLKGTNPPGDPKPVKFTEGTPDFQAEYALKRLTEVVTRFDDEATPYQSLVHPMWTTHYGEYDHLARVKEWSARGEEDEW
ncbi:MAG: double-strand break repair protein AddB, partial [Pseudolabrys sp.]|nr:double-strand break repair protein AddB [Pseudolabrys sp.]